MTLTISMDTFFLVSTAQPQKQLSGVWHVNQLVYSGAAFSNFLHPCHSLMAHGTFKDLDLLLAKFLSRRQIQTEFIFYFFFL